MVLFDVTFVTDSLILKYSFEFLISIFPVSDFSDISHLSHKPYTSSMGYISAYNVQSYKKIAPHCCEIISKACIIYTVLSNFLLKTD